MSVTARAVRTGRASDGDAAGNWCTLPDQVMPRDRYAVPAPRWTTAPPTARLSGARFAGWSHYGHLLRNLVVKDLKLKYRGSVLGFVWSLANPLLMIAVYTIAFTYILRLRTPGSCST